MTLGRFLAFCAAGNVLGCLALGAIMWASGEPSPQSPVAGAVIAAALCVLLTAQLHDFAEADEEGLPRYGRALRIQLGLWAFVLLFVAVGAAGTA